MMNATFLIYIQVTLLDFFLKKKNLFLKKLKIWNLFEQ